MNQKLNAILAELKTHFKDLYGDRLVQMTLFGSQARAEGQSGSDIDVLVVLKESVNPGKEITRTGKIVADLSLQHDEVISCLFMDEDRFRSRNGPLLRNIRKEGILL